MVWSGRGALWPPPVSLTLNPFFTMPYTAAYKAAVLNRLFGGVTSGLSADKSDLYFGLMTVAPGTDGTGFTECTGTSYARIQKANDTTRFATITAGQTKVNSEAITFPSPGASDWGSIVAVGIWDALSSGNLLCWGLPTAFTPVSGNAPVIPIGIFTAQLL